VAALGDAHLAQGGGVLFHAAPPSLVRGSK
jgi:hypothetical protein